MDIVIQLFPVTSTSQHAADKFGQLNLNMQMQTVCVSVGAQIAYGAILTSAVWMFEKRIKMEKGFVVYGPYV